MRRLLLIALVLATAQDKPFDSRDVVALAQDRQAPVFRSGVDLVTVDVTVIDGKSDPIEGLSADRFEVSVDGTPRRVVWAEFVRQGGTPLAAPSTTDHFTTNEGTDAGRIVLIAVDAIHIRRVEGLAALRAASNFVDALDRSDRVAAVRINDGAPIQFTTDHATVKRQLQRLTGEASFMPAHFKIGLVESLAIADGSRTVLDQVVVRECGQPLGRFENLARLAEANGVRDPCPVQVEQEGRAMAQQTRTEARLTMNALSRLLLRLAEIEGPKTLVLLSEGLVAEPQLIDMTALGAAAQAAQVTLHVLQLETPILDASSDTVSPTLYRDIQTRADGLARLAGSARGGMFRLVGDDPYPFRRIVKELSSHYLVSFEPIPADRDGRMHRIEVRVKAANAQVRARPAFLIPPAANAAPVETDLVQLLRNPRLARGLPVRVAAYSFRESGDRLHLLVSAEMDHAAGNPDATAGFVLIDSRGVIAASGGGATERGRFVQPVSIAPGRYTLKAAAIDAGGRRGSVERLLEVKPPDVSDLMIAVPPAQKGDSLRPVVLRATGDRVVAYLEVYGAPQGKIAAVVDVQREGVSAPIASHAAHVASQPGRVAITADIPLASLEPGAYLATVRIDGTPHVFTRRFVVAR